MNNDELHIMLETLKRKKKFRDLDLDRFQRVLGDARSGYESFSFDPAPFLMEIKKEGTGALSSRPVMKDGMVRQLFSMRYGLPSLAATAAAAVIVAVFWFMPFSTHQAGRALCSFSYGDVQLHRGNETLAVNPGTEFLHGDRVVTGDRSLADVVVDEATKIRVRSNTSLMISSILGHAKGRPMNLDVGIGKGTVLFSFKKLGKGDTATVRTPTSVAGVRGTSFGVEVLEDRSVRYEVLEGKVRVRPHADVSGISTESSSAVQQQVDDVLEQESVTVSSNQVCRIGGDAGDRIVHAVREALRHGTISGTTLNVNALQVRPAVSSTEESGTRMLSDVRAISTRENKNIKNTAVIELAVDVFPESAGVRIDGDVRGKGDVAIITAPGVHTIEVSEKGYVPKIIQKRFTPADRSISVRLERDSGRFSFREWAARANSSMLFTVTHAGMLVNVSRSGKIEAVGKHGVIWKRDLHSHLTAVPSWDRERLYCATGNERITALSLADGRSLWVRKIEGILLFGSAVEPAGDSLFAGTSRGNLYRFSRNGRMMWRTAFEGGIFASPFVSGNTVFVPVQDGNLYKVNRIDGKVSGRINTGKVIGSSRIVRGDRLYLANYNGEVICYNHVRDTVEWRYATGGNVIIATLLDGDRLYVINAGGTIYNLTTGGSLRWKTELGSSIKADPVIRGGNLYAVTERVLYMIDTGSGNVKWSYVMEHFPATGVTISDNNLYVGTEKNGIIVLRKD